MTYGLSKSSSCDDLGCTYFKVICKLQSFSNGMFHSCKISSDKHVVQSLCNSRASFVFVVPAGPALLCLASSCVQVLMWSAWRSALSAVTISDCLHLGCHLYSYCLSLAYLSRWCQLGSVQWEPFPSLLLHHFSYPLNPETSAVSQGDQWKVGALQNLHFEPRKNESQNLDGTK